MIPASCNARQRRECDAPSVPLRCLIVDDNAAFVAAARSILDGPQLTVVGDAATVAEAHERAHKLAVDVILIDIDLGEESGLALARELAARNRNPAPRIVLISAHPEDDFADLIAESPAVGFVAKSELSALAVAELLPRTDDGSGEELQRDSS